MLDDLPLDQIQDPVAREVIARLLAIIEQLQAENAALRAQNQRLHEENRRLKGLPAVPKLPQKKAPLPQISSETERREPKNWTKSAKLPQLVIDREVPLRLSTATLPPDTVSKGFEAVVVQEVLLSTETVRYLREKRYSPSTGQSFLAPLPPGYHGHFGPGVRALALSLCYEQQVSHALALKFLRALKLSISSGELSQMLTQESLSWEQEATEVLRAGLQSSPWQHLDETPTPLKGKGYHTQVLCNPLYCAYFTRPSKDRLTVLEVLRLGAPKTFRLDERAFHYFSETPLSQKVQRRLRELEWEVQDLSEAELLALLAERIPQLGPQQRTWIQEACGVAAYHAQEEWPVIDLLITDDAPQYQGLTAQQALCWVHEGRHFKKLSPYLAVYRERVEEFRRGFWAYYRKLREYQQAPTAKARSTLEEEFDTLFSQETGYSALEDRLFLTRQKKERLLKVLSHPEIPLHNNPAELTVRGRVRKRRVSFGPQSEAGARAWDTFQTLSATCAKLGVSFYHYLKDRLTLSYQMPSLASLIAERAATLNLGASWATA